MSKCMGRTKSSLTYVYNSFVEYALVGFPLAYHFSDGVD
jgi:hypothetical protein